MFYIKHTVNPPRISTEIILHRAGDGEKTAFCLYLFSGKALAVHQLEPQKLLCSQKFLNVCVLMNEK